ncbi:hypothetical protein B484DRAFT_398645 [Ochromonadaceae sp. CCMP2298]|nr:hypothetical protein B484DRAFT_398645 [Ochromonadaceae sp. CCMP2298]
MRGRGVAQFLNKLRINAAQKMGARSIMATASEANMRLLLKLGFFDIGQRIYFEDRPDTQFFALQYNFP